MKYEKLAMKYETVYLKSYDTPKFIWMIKVWMFLIFFNISL